MPSEAEAIREKPSAAPLQLRLFGTFALLRAGVPLPSPRTRKGQWLLAFLILRKGKAVDRYWLSATLWPDSTETQAKHNLRNSLKDLRRILKQDAACLTAPSPRTLAFDATNTECDLIAFDSAIARGDASSLEQALALYGGDLLQGCDAEWVSAERETRVQAYLGALESLSAQALAASPERAVHHLRRLIVADPLRESACRQLMTALWTLGDSAAVQEVYRALRSRLLETLNAAPDEETTALYRELRDRARTPAPLPSRPSGIPPLTPSAPLRHNLPASLTSFIGREKEIAEVAELLGRTRLLTVTGAGGCGKTRLALQVATDILEAYPDGVWFVELAPLLEAALVPQTVAMTLDIKEKAGEAIEQTLLENLRNKALLLVLDNCEHLLPACAALAAPLLRACPNIQMLATSRERLGIMGELTYRVPPLSLPERNHFATSVESLRQYESARLFIERAQLHQPSFALDNRSALPLAQICHRLDGIPLAIELAAPWVRSISLEEINTRLDNRFRLLRGGDRTALPRQQTLRSLIDWSHDLLNEQEQVLLARLSVFVGVWTLDAAEAVCGFSPLEAWEVLDLVTSLVDKSLVQAETREDATRYRMLETIRQYAAEKLAGGETDRVKDRHRDHFLALAEEAEPHLRGANQATWMDRLETEHDNLRAALAWCCAADTDAKGVRDGEAGLRLAAALRWFWDVRGYFTEGREHLARALSRQGGSRTAAAARALNTAGQLAWRQGDHTVAELLFKESLAIYEEIGDKQGIGIELINLSLIATDRGDGATARSLLEESLALQRQLGNRHGIAQALNNLSMHHCLVGRDYAIAASLLDECVSLRRELADQQGIAEAVNNQGLVAWLQGDFTASRLHQEEALRLSQELRDRRGVAAGLEFLALPLLSESQVQRAVTLWGAADALRESIGSPEQPASKVVSDPQVAKARSLLGEAVFTSAWEEGRAMPWEQAVEYALEEVTDSTMTSE